MNNLQEGQRKYKPQTKLLTCNDVNLEHTLSIFMNTVNKTLIKDYTFVFFLIGVDG